MSPVKIVLLCILAAAVAAEKKIELQDIEDDNIKSEKEKDLDKSEGRAQSSEPEAQGLVPLEFLKSGLLRYFESPTHQPQRYVHQYAVTEPPERVVPAAPKVRYGPPTAQQVMVGYLSNDPMQIYLVPQYYNEPSQQASNTQSGVPYTAPGVTQIAYQSAAEAMQQQANYIEVPTYVAPTGKTYIQQYTSPIAYVGYAQPTAMIPAQSTVAPVLTYQMPVVQYPTSITAPPVVPKEYYQNQQQYTEKAADEEVQENEIESPKQYATQTEVPYTKIPQADYPRYYNSRTPLKEELRHGSITELPHPNPLILKGPPSHLSHIPKALPIFRPITKPIYATSGSIISNSYTQRPHEVYGVPYKRRPTSLLDSYIPSSVQIEYLKKGYTKDPLAAYEALSSARHFSPVPYPRHYERGFLPNQMYHTAAGGITFGHYKRTPKLDPSSRG